MSSDPYYQYPRSQMLAFLPDEYSKVLEVGCGAGSFIKSLPESKERWGVEQDATAAKSAAKHLDKVLIGTYQSVRSEIPDNYFDLIVCNDVIEHMQDHEDFLRRIKSKLADGGALIVSIPNVRFLPNLFELMVKRDWRYREAGILDKTHLRFFTRKSFRRALEETGWMIEEIHGINRYGGKWWGPKRIVSLFGQVLLGRDTAFMQFGMRAVPLLKS